MRSLRLFLVTGGLSLLMVSALVGCGASSAESEDVSVQAPAQEQESQPEMAIVGKQSDEAYKILLTNKLGSSVKALSIKEVGEDSFPSSMLTSSDEIADDETVELYFTPKNNDDKIMYDILVVLEDGSSYELHNLALADFETMEFESNDGVAFVAYTTTDGKTENTEAAELALIEQAEQEAAEQAAAEQAAAEQAAAEQEAAEQAAAAQAAANQADRSTVPPEQGESSSEEGYSETPPENPQQVEDGCIEGGVVLR